MRSFERITGPKTDDWLVHMVGVLAALIGTTLLVAALRNSISGEVVLLAAGAAFAFLLIDVIYWRSGILRDIYLADAVLEVILLLMLCLSGARRIKGGGSG
jgi:hypothetical protein